MMDGFDIDIGFDVIHVHVYRFLTHRYLTQFVQLYAWYAVNIVLSQATVRLHGN